MVGERQIEFVTYSCSTDKFPAQQSLTEGEFATILLEHDETPCEYPCTSAKCPHKDSLAWSHGFIPLGKPRLDGNVTHFDVLGFDLDHLTPERFAEVCTVLDDMMVLIYSTHRHTPEDVRVRLVFFLSRRVLAHEYKALRAAIVRKFDLPEDKKARNPGRIFFMPTSPRGGQRLAVFNDGGARVDVDAFLVDQMRASKERVASPAPTREPGEVDLGDLRSCLKRYDPQDDYDGTKRALISKVLKGEPLADKGARDDAVHRVATITGWLLPIDTPAEAAIELLRPAIASIPQYEDDGADENPDGWLRKAQYSYEKAATKKLAEMEGRNNVLAIAKRKKAREAAQGGSGAPPGGSGAPPGGSGAPPGPPAGSGAPSGGSGAPPGPQTSPGGSGDDIDAPWRLRLVQKVDKHGYSTIERVGANVSIILRNHSAWQGIFRYNVLRHEYEAVGGPIPPEERVAERLLTAVQNWLATEEKLPLPAHEVDAQLEFIARERMYDPIQDYLLGLKWDGVGRIDSWLETYCGARIEGPITKTYLQAIGRKWLISAAARALVPGVKADNVLVLEGPQRVGKSTTLQILGGKWFSEAKAGLQSKDTLELTSKTWIVELPELSAMRRSETEAHKAFFSADHDSFRLAYARRVGEYKRRCVFAGSTNEEEYLHDETGNSRYWPVYCDHFDLDALRRDRDQLWAEAVHLYKEAESCPACALPDRCEKHRWWFDRKQSEAIAEPVTTTRLKGDFVEAIRSWYVSRDAKDRPAETTTTFIATVILGIAVDRIEQQRQAIGRAARRLGLTKRRASDERRTWVYDVPRGLLDAPKVERRSHLVVHTTQKTDEVKAGEVKGGNSKDTTGKKDGDKDAPSK